MKKIINKKVIFECRKTPLLSEDGKYRYVYKIKFPDGTYYIGKHRTKTLNDGYCGSGCFLPKAFSKNDESKIIKEIINFAKDDKELNLIEEKEIGDYYKLDDNCLNYQKGGTGGFEEFTIRKSAFVRKGKKRSGESIEKQRKACTGKKHSEETKKIISEKRKKYFTTERGHKDIEKLAEMARGRFFSEETRKKIAEATKKRWQKKGKNYFSEEGLKRREESLKKRTNFKHTDETKKKIKEKIEEHYRIYGTRQHTDEEKKKISNSNKGKSLSKETKDKIRIARTGKKASEETKQKFSEMRKGRGNPRYCRQKIIMLTEDGLKIEKIFKDCIEAVEYVKENINVKANGSEIFVACRTGKTRYKHKWKKEENN